jgi:hypothetical protein
MVESVQLKRMMEVLPDADNELRVAIEASPGTMPPQNIIAPIGDSEEDRIALMSPVPVPWLRASSSERWLRTWGWSILLLVERVVPSFSMR